VQVGTLDEPYLVAGGLPVAYSVPRSTGGGTIDGNGVLRLLRPPAHGSTYEVSAVIAEQTPDQLRHPGSGALAAPPDATDATPFAGGPAVPAFGVAGRDAAVDALLATRPAWHSAYAWAVLRTEGAATPYDVALRLEQALRDTHPYSDSSTLSASDPDALAHWVLSGQAGYCQMFSASMTELLRLLGVPARIAEGFDTGLYDPSSKRYVVDDRDAHAWVEAWMPGTGYVPFDPTPGHTLPDQAAIVHTGTTTQRTTPATTATATPRATTSATAARPVARGEGSLVPRPLVLVLLGVLALVVTVVLIALAALRRRPRDPDPRVVAALARQRLADRARRRGSDPAPGITNGALAELLHDELGLDATAWAEAADRAAYAPLADATAAVPGLEAETARLADEIRARPRVTIPV
jgi:transglutaminase-like putative cysteine protease